MKRLIFTLLCATAVSACAQPKTTVTGRLGDVSDGTKVTLVPGAIHATEDPAAEAVVADGEFLLEVTLDEPRLFLLRAEGLRDMAHLMLSPGDQATVVGTLGDPEVSGAALQEEYVEKFVKPRAEMNRLHSEIQQRYSDVSRLMGEARGRGDQEAVRQITESEEWKAFGEAESDFFNQMDRMLTRAIEENAATFWAPLLLLSHTAYLTQENESHYGMFSDQAKQSYYGRVVAKEIFGITGEAPDFTAADADGREHSLADILTGENYVLVDFWASWCGPCRRFVPTLKELAAKYADRGLTVVSISTDKDRAAWLKALEEEQMPWLNLRDESGISTAYGVSGIPSVFLIAPSGKIVFAKQSGQSVVDKLTKTFGE